MVSYRYVIYIRNTKSVKHWDRTGCISRLTCTHMKSSVVWRSKIVVVGDLLDSIELFAFDVNVFVLKSNIPRRESTLLPHPPLNTTCIGVFINLPGNPLPALLCLQEDYMYFMGTALFGCQMPFMPKLSLKSSPFGALVQLRPETRSISARIDKQQYICIYSSFLMLYHRTGQH